MGRAFEVRKKAREKTNASKTKIYSRFGKELFIAAKAGVPDPEMNQGLKRMIERAKANQVPADVIKRAIDKAKGGSEDSYTSVRYEGFGPGNCTIIVDCLTDNVNRTVSDVRNCFTKTKSKMGVSGSVAHLYDHIGILAFNYDNDELVLDTLIEHEVDVIDVEKEDETINVTVQPNDLYKAKTAIETILPELEFSALETTMIPHDTVKLSGEDEELFTRFMNMIDELDDVQEVYHNVDE
jgi:YebC/PmpR family DNA-binding regulatory protein